MLKTSTKTFARAGIIAGLYTAISLIIFPIASGGIQIRLSEGLTLLAVIFPEAIFGLSVGCLLSNLITGCAPFDVVFGSIITLVSALLTFVCTRKINSNFLRILIGGIFPVVLNAVLLPLVWIYCYNALEYIYPVQALLILVGQAISVYVVGTPVLIATDRLKKKGLNFFN